jgi:hypothetical protein
MGPFQRAKTIMQKIAAGGGDWKLASEFLQSLLQDENLLWFKKSPSFLVPLEEVFDDVARLTVFTVSLHPPTVSPDVLVFNIFFYDVAEGLMTMYTRGEFSIRYMPKARQQRAESLRRIKEILEEVGIVKNNVLTGLGQMVAKSLLSYVVRRGISVESIYLSALIAFTLFAEMRSFSGTGSAVLMEAAARHRRLTDTVKEWLRASPKLYHKDIILFYEWEDAVKDFALNAEKAEDFRFTI